MQVDDDGPGAPPGASPTGKGIVGMRERVHALGGELEVGHRRRPRVPRARPHPGRGGAVSTPVIRVVLADDQALVRAGFLALLDAQDDIEVVGEAADGDEAVAVTRRERPDVVLMDIRMPGADGLAATRSIGDDPALDAVRVVILTTFELDEYVFEALRAGASGFLVKDTEPTELLRAVRAVAAGDALLSPSVTRRLIEAFATTAGDAPVAVDLDLLTNREREVMTLVAAWLEQRRDRRAALREHRDGEDPREPGDDEARRARPRPTRGARLRVGLGAGRRVVQTPRLGPRGGVFRFFGGGGVMGLPASSFRARLLETRGGSPGIFGYTGGHGASSSPDAMSRSYISSSGVSDLRVVGDVGPGIAARLDACRHGERGAGLGIDVVELVPVERRRHLGGRARSDRPRAEHRLVRRVLVEVDEDALPALFLPPRVGDRVGSTAGELARHRHRGAAHLDRCPPRFEARVHVDAAVAGGLGPPADAQLVEQTLQLAGRFTHLVEPEAGLRVEVDAQLVGVLVVGAPGWATRGSRGTRGSPPTRCGRGRRRRGPRDVVPLGVLTTDVSSQSGAFLGHPLLEERSSRRRRSGSAA